MVTPFYENDLVRIYHGDCRELLPALALEPQLVLADPPYGDTALDWDRWPDGWLAALPASCPQMWCFGSMRIFLGRAAEFEGWAFGQEIVWEKHNGSGFLADRFKRVHEFAVQWYRGRWSSLTLNPQFVAEATARTVRRHKSMPPHMRQIDSGVYESVDGGPKMQRSVIYVRGEHGRAVHPTQKPIGIIEPLMRYSSLRGDLVLDPMCGSGSALVAAQASGRRAVGIEASGEFCELAARRCSEVLAL